MNSNLMSFFATFWALLIVSCGDASGPTDPNSREPCQAIAGRPGTELCVRQVGYPVSASDAQVLIGSFDNAPLPLRAYEIANASRNPDGSNRQMTRDESQAFEAIRDELQRQIDTKIQSVSIVRTDVRLLDSRRTDRALLRFIPDRPCNSFDPNRWVISAVFQVEFSAVLNSPTELMLDYIRRGHSDQTLESLSAEPGRVEIKFRGWPVYIRERINSFCPVIR
jgi:hypothetical protein